MTYKTCMLHLNKLYNWKSGFGVDTEFVLLLKLNIQFLKFKKHLNFTRARLSNEHKPSKLLY
jgi:hypothetical protein